MCLQQTTSSVPLRRWSRLRRRISLRQPPVVSSLATLICATDTRRCAPFRRARLQRYATQISHILPRSLHRPLLGSYRCPSTPEPPESLPSSSVTPETHSSCADPPAPARHLTTCGNTMSQTVRTATTFTQLTQAVACAIAAPNTRYIVYLSSASYEVPNYQSISFGGHIEVRRSPSATTMPMIAKYRGQSHCSCSLVVILANSNVTWVGIGVKDGYSYFPYVFFIPYAAASLSAYFHRCPFLHHSLYLTKLKLQTFQSCNSHRLTEEQMSKLLQRPSFP